VALAVVAVALVTIAVGARQLDGGVLSATGTPAGTTDGGIVSGSDGDAGPVSTSSGIPAPSSSLR
jgi:hypothetical protein